MVPLPKNIERLHPFTIQSSPIQNPLQSNNITVAKLRVYAVDLWVSLVYQRSDLYVLPVHVHNSTYLLGRRAISAALSPSRKSTKEFTLKILFRTACLVSDSDVNG